MIGCLIIHGYTGGPHEVEPLATYLRTHTNWDIRVPTLPGHGENLQLEDMTHDKWLEKAEKLLQELTEQYDETYVIGFSMGGMIAAYLAAKYKLEKLVLLAAARKYMSLKQLSVDIGEVIVDGLRGKLHENEFYVNFNQKRNEVPIKANVEFVKLVRYTRPYLKEIESPVLIAHGQQDTVVPPKTIHYLDKEIKSDQKEVVLFDQSDHRICLGDDKDVLNELVYDFLMENDQQPTQ